MNEEMKIKSFKEGNLEVFVGSKDSVIEVTTAEHLKTQNKPLDQIIHEVVDDAVQYAKEIFSKYETNWFPCGFADVVLQWNRNRDLINFLVKEAFEKRSDFYRGWFGSLHKTRGSGWRWSPPIKQSQSMHYTQAVCDRMRDKLAFADIVVDVRTMID